MILYVGHYRRRIDTISGEVRQGVSRFPLIPCIATRYLYVKKFLRIVFRSFVHCEILE